jgi:hypothetical protein
MKNYDINRTFGFFRLPINLTSDNGDSFEEFSVDNLVDAALTNEIGTINDYEITTFVPRYGQMVFDVNFYRQIDSNLNPTGDTQIRYILSEPYTSYYDQIQTYFQNSATFTGSTFPTFWNSLCYPFYSKKNTWFTCTGQTLSCLKPKRFDPNPYMYNSFIKMNFYTTPYSTNQELVFQNVIYVNPRWCELEGDANGSWHRPTFTLNKTTDGYYLYWLNTFTIGTFYVNFQFWDALNGRLINLIPTSDFTSYKQWIQNAAIFDSRMMYMEYTLQYSNKTYSMGEFNPTTKLWDIHVPQIKLYEVVFDNYLFNFNPHINVQNGTYIVPVIPPSPTAFNLQLGGSLAALLSSTDDTLAINSSNIDILLFDDIRSAIDTKVSQLPTQSMRNLTVYNNGTGDVYLKDIEIVGFTETGPTKISRIIDSSKNWDGTNTTYTFATVPTPNISFVLDTDLNNNPSLLANALQPYFDYYYQFTETNNSIWDATDTSPNWWESKRMMKWFYPITSSNISSFGYPFAEQLSIQYGGNDLYAISSGSTLNLMLTWGLGNNYSTVYFEPYFYKITNNKMSFPLSQHINLMYTVKLLFNNLQNTLPTEANTLSFDIPVSFELRYTYVGPNPHSGGDGGGGDNPGKHPQ